jgi:hypothetical protein
MPKFDVRVFEVVKVKVCEVEADNVEEACVKARDGYDPDALFDLVASNDGADTEYADETSHYFVTPAGAEEDTDNDQWLLATKAGPAPVSLEQLNGMDNLVLDVVLPTREWDVPVCRVGYGHNTLRVEARTAEEAKQIALEEAGNHEYSEKSSEYEAPDGAIPVEDDAKESKPS